jgi:hypothetical protein
MGLDGCPKSPISTSETNTAGGHPCVSAPRPCACSVDHFELPSSLAKPYRHSTETNFSWVTELVKPFFNEVIFFFR